MSDLKLDEKDTKILRLLQKDSKLSTKEIAKQIGSPVTTVYAKIRRMEHLGLITGYKAILNASRLGKPTTAFVLVSLRIGVEKELFKSRDIANELAKNPEVQEVHMVSGDWDLLLKLKVENIQTLGSFIIEKLRTVTGVEKTETWVVFDTAKETSEISI